MRIGTWNLEGRWSPAHLALLVAHKCDVWLLTEVHVDTAVPGMTVHLTVDRMARDRAWAGIVGVDCSPETDPHFATARVSSDGVSVMSSVLPWRACGERWPGDSPAERSALALDEIRPHVGPLTIWGGDWNHAFAGRDHVGTRVGRAAIESTLDAAGMSLPTAHLASAVDGHAAIDHVAVPRGWNVVDARRVRAVDQGRRLSDHDAYVVEVHPSAGRPRPRGPRA